MFNPFDISKRKTGIEYFLLQSRENFQIVKETIQDLIREDAKTYCNKNVVWDALDICQLNESDLSSEDLKELCLWVDRTYNHKFWY